MTSKVIEGHNRRFPYVTLFCSPFSWSHFCLLPNTFIYESILIKKKKIWMLITMIGKYFSLISITSKVIEGHKSSMIKFLSKFLSHFFLLPNTFIYEPILIKIYMNANIMNTQIFRPFFCLKLPSIICLFHFK